jgi:hypothetical protein
MRLYISLSLSLYIYTYILNRYLSEKITPLYQLRVPFRLKLGGALLNRVNNHVKCTVQIFHGGVQTGSTKVSQLVPTSQTQLKAANMGIGIGGSFESTATATATAAAESDGVLRKCSFNEWVDFSDVSLNVGDIPYACRLIFNFYSKNNHALGWCGKSKDRTE